MISDIFVKPTFNLRGSNVLPSSNQTFGVNFPAAPEWSSGGDVITGGGSVLKSAYARRVQMLLLRYLSCHGV